VFEIEVVEDEEDDRAALRKSYFPQVNHPEQSQHRPAAT
jgi:hypothetical protein